MNLHDVKRRARALLRPHRVEQELQDELEFHIERETKTLIDGGLAPLEARRMARVRFGSAARAADECRDKRGTAVIDHTIRDIQYALRTFKRAPLTSLTIVATVATGLGVVAVLFTILNALLFRVDAVPDIAQLYAVERPRQADGGRGALFTRPRVDALRSDTSVFTDAYAMLGDIDLRVDGRTMAVSLVSGSFFHVVGVNPVMGRPFGAADDDRAGGNPVVVLSDKGWQRHFNRDPNVLGRTVLVAGAPFEIVGVMPMGFRGLEFSAPDFWAPLPRVFSGRIAVASARRSGWRQIAVPGRVPELRSTQARGRMMTRRCHRAWSRSSASPETSRASA